MKRLSIATFTFHGWMILGLSVAGAILGVATIIIVRSVTNSFQQDLLSKLGGVSGETFTEAMKVQDQVTTLIVMLSMLVVGCSLISGFIVLRKRNVSGPAS